MKRHTCSGLLYVFTEATAKDDEARRQAFYRQRSSAHIQNGYFQVYSFDYRTQRVPFIYSNPYEKCQKYILFNTPPQDMLETRQTSGPSGSGSRVVSYFFINATTNNPHRLLLQHFLSLLSLPHVIFQASWGTAQKRRPARAAKMRFVGEQHSTAGCKHKQRKRITMTKLRQKTTVHFSFRLEKLRTIVSSPCRLFSVHSGTAGCADNVIKRVAPRLIYLLKIFGMEIAD